MSSTQWGERKAGASKDEVESGKWIAVQKRIFTRWANAYLKTRKMHIDDLCTDLADGLVLINLMEILTHEPFPKKYKKNPKMRIHQMENLKSCFEWFEEIGMKLTNMGASDVCDGNEKIILGLMWTIISRLQIGEIQLDGVSGKEGLLMWCKRATSGYDNVNLKNFHRAWKDGLAFCAIIHKHRPDVIDYEALSADNSADNLAMAFQLAEDFFGIDRILDVEDIVDAAKPDEKIIITYVAFVFKGMADFLRRQGLAKSIGKAVDITVRHDAWIAEYNEKATALSAWVSEQIATYSNREHGNTADDIKAGLDAFNAYKSHTKPDYKGQLASLEGLYNTFLSSARNNNRPVYKPPAGLELTSIEHSWTELEATENAYETDIRAAYRLFRNLENTIARFLIKAEKTETWAAAQLAVFQGAVYGDSLVATQTLLSAYATYEKQLGHFNDLSATLTSWATGGGMERHARYAELTERCASVAAQLDEVNANGVAYKEQLDLAKERHEKLGALDKVYVWVAQQLEFFGAGAYGDSLLETNALIEEHTNWTVQLAPKQEVVDSMTSEQEVITERIESERANIATVVEQADIYRQYLGLQQEVYVKFDAMDKVAGWMENYNALFAAQEYGDTLGATRTLISSFQETFKVNLPAKKAVLDEMTSEQESITERLATERETMAQLEETAENYHTWLLLSEERHEKLPMLDNVEAWLDQQLLVFQSGDHGDTLAGVALLLSGLETYRANLVPQKDTVETMESYQEEILNRQAELKEKLATTEAAAEEYHMQLLMSQERLDKLPTLDRIDTWMDAQNELFVAGNYGATLVEVATLLSSYDTFLLDLNSKKATLEGMTSEQDVITTRLAEVQEKLAATEECGAGYQQELYLSQERLEKLPALARVEAWLLSQNEVFAAGDYGDSLVAVATLLETFGNFARQLAPHKEFVSTLETNQQVIADRHTAVSELLASTEAAGEEYNLQLLLCQERLTKLPKLASVAEWLVAQQAVFDAGDYGVDLAAVSRLQESLHAYQLQLDRHKEFVHTMDSEQADIIAKRDEVQATLADTEAKAAEYEAALQASAAHFQHLHDVNMSYNNHVDEFLFEVDDLADEMNEPIMDGVLEAIQTMRTNFEDVIKPRVNQLSERYNAIDAEATELTEAGVEDAFSRYTLQDVYDKYTIVYNLTASREETLDAELAAEQGRDEMRQRFAGLATALREFVDRTTAEVGALTGSLQDQLAALLALKKAYKDDTQLPAINAAAAELEEAGIVDNPYSPETVHSLNAVWNVLGTVLDDAEESLRGQILAQRDESITPEQIKEIKEVFEFFDQDRDDNLKVSEFRDCCTGIGMVMTDDELAATLAEIDADGNGLIDFEEFTEFMVKRLVEPGHTQEDVHVAFTDLADKETYVTGATLTRTFMNVDHLNYLRENMPPSDAEEDAFEHAPFVESLFSR